LLVHPAARPPVRQDTAAASVTKIHVSGVSNSGNGPVLVEAFTYRMDAHITSDDPSRYRLPRPDEGVYGALAVVHSGSPLTPSRPGRWPTRTTTSRMTRSTRCAATGTGRPRQPGK
jgi:hypothetical protein